MTSNIFDKSQEKLNQCPEFKRCNLLVIGKTGVGKSTLINTIFENTNFLEVGNGQPITKEITRCYRTNKSYGLNIYDTPGFEINKDNQKEIINFINKKKLECFEEHIHIVWYCISNESGRFEDSELNFIKDISRIITVFIVLTKTYNQNEDQDEKSLYNKVKKIVQENNIKNNIKVIPIIPILAEDKKINDNYTVKAHGLDTLINESCDILQYGIKGAFINAISDIDRKEKATITCLKNYITLGSALPIVSTYIHVFSPVIPHHLIDKATNMLVIIFMFNEFQTIFELDKTSTEFNYPLLMCAIGLDVCLELSLEKFKDFIPNLLSNAPSIVVKYIPILNLLVSNLEMSSSTAITGLALIKTFVYHQNAILNGKSLSNNDLVTFFKEIFNKLKQSPKEVLTQLA